ncbi:9420_t:CDS:1, partial [Cetraspora pellucida]
EMFVQDIVQDECQTNIVDDNISTFDTNTLYINDNPINNIFDVLDSENSIITDNMIDDIVFDNSNFDPFNFDNANSYN